MSPTNENAYLEAYVAEPSPNFTRRAILVLPGGGYYRLCKNIEGEVVAQAFMAQGFNAFVLNYSVILNNETEVFPAQLIEASRAIKHIKDNAEDYNIDPDEVFAVGFSAGGHLCASLGSLWNSPELRAALPDMSEGINRPTGTILCYAVLSAHEVNTHNGTLHTAMGTQTPTQEQREIFSIDRRISVDTAPAFFMHTVADQAVPVQNALVTMKAMADKGISFDARIYPHGPHGMALAERQTSFGNPPFEDEEIVRWVDDAVYWMKHM